MRDLVLRFYSSLNRLDNFDLSYRDDALLLRPLSHRFIFLSVFLVRLALARAKRLSTQLSFIGIAVGMILT